MQLHCAPEPSLRGTAPAATTGRSHGAVSCCIELGLPPKERSERAPGQNQSLPEAEVKGTQEGGRWAPLCSDAPDPSQSMSQ